MPSKMPGLHINIQKLNVRSLENGTVALTEQVEVKGRSLQNGDNYKIPSESSLLPVNHDSLTTDTSSSLIPTRKSKRVIEVESKMEDIDAETKSKRGRRNSNCSKCLCCTSPIIFKRSLSVITSTKPKGSLQSVNRLIDIPSAKNVVNGTKYGADSSKLEKFISSPTAIRLLRESSEFCKNNFPQPPLPISKFPIGTSMTLRVNKKKKSFGVKKSAPMPLGIKKKTTSKLLKNMSDLKMQKMMKKSSKSNLLNVMKLDYVKESSSEMSVQVPSAAVSETRPMKSDATGATEAATRESSSILERIPRKIFGSSVAQGTRSQNSDKDG